MTRLPAENRDVVGLEGPEYPRYKVGPLCSVPGCSRLADHPHHIWRRSFIIGDKAWVKLWDGTIVQNITGLCWRHHDNVTVNKAQIRWTGENFVWDGPLGDEAHLVTGALLDPQPKRWVHLWNEDNLEPRERHEHIGPASGEKCPTCKRSVPRESTGPKEKKRNREKWSVSVPKDERENGADVLDTLLQSCAELFGHDDTKTLRYFTLVQALALVVQHGEKMVGDD